MHADVAWAAGLFEGEGCFSVSQDKRRPNTFTARATLSMRDESVVRRFAGIVGVGHVRPFHPPSHAEAGHSPQTRWEARSWGDVQFVYELLRPYLSDYRRAQAVAALVPGGRRTPMSLDGHLAVDSYR